jgi:hypothetical protein
MPVRIPAMILSFIGAYWYGIAMVKCSPSEIFITALGLLALWFPFGWVISQFTHDQFDDRLSHFTFCVISTFGLTTTIYFACAVIDQWVPGFFLVFYILQIAAVLTCALLSFRQRGTWTFISGGDLRRKFFRIDWFLVLLIVASSITTVRYKNILEFDPVHKNYLLTSSPDQYYFTAVSYECARHLPMLQTPYRAGMKSRAYHMFPHLTTTLIAEYSRQQDFPKAHLIYEFTFREVFLLLSVFCISRILSGSRAVGYAAVTGMFLGAVPLQPLITENAMSIFYFCLWPQSSSSIEPVLMTSPQQYSATLLVYGILLGVTMVSKRVARGADATRIMLVVSILTGIMFRFRVQMFVPLLVGMIILAAYYYRKTRAISYLGGGAITLLLSAALIFEARLPIYLPSSAKLTLGNNLIALQLPFINSWPGANVLRLSLESLLVKDSSIFQWVWQVLSISFFTFFNIIGIPILTASLAYLCSRKAWAKFGGINFLILTLVTGSIVGAICVAAAYDTWSVGGQMILHTSWYLYPLLFPGISLLVRWVSKKAKFVLPKLSILVGVAVIASLFVWQCTRSPSPLENEFRRADIRIDIDELEALRYIRSNLPRDAVILSNHPLSETTCVFSGIAGRRAYLEYANNTERLIEPPKYDWGKERSEQISKIWAATTDEEFTRLVPSVVTHLVEFRNTLPLRISPRCCREVFLSSNGHVRVWEVLR